MNNSIAKIILSFIVCLGCEVFAEPYSDLFPNAEIAYTSSENDAQYRFTLGELKKVNGNWVTEREEFLQGKVSRRTLELTGYSNIRDAAAVLDQYFNLLSARPLFVCSGLDCGSSAAWANNRFNVKQLYGLDQHQAYRALEVDNNGVNLYVAAYIVQRGNKRIYVQVDTIQQSGNSVLSIVPSVDIVKNTLKQKGFYVIPGLSMTAGKIGVDDEQLKPIVSALGRIFGQKVFIVGHDFSKKSDEDRRQQSKLYAEHVQDRLSSLGLKLRQVETVGIGGLAPSSRRKQESVRIEIVLQ